MPYDNWTFLTSHAVVLLYLATHPRASIREIAQELGLGVRTVAGALADLTRAGCLTVTQVGRRRVRSIRIDAPMRQPAFEDYKLGEFFALLKGASGDSL